MDEKCPGRTANAILESTLLTCSKCGQDSEIFTDEVRVHCKCGEWLYRQTMPSCIQWCPEAERCMGAVNGLKQMLEATTPVHDQKKYEERLKELQERIAVALETCSSPESRHRNACK